MTPGQLKLAIMAGALLLAVTLAGVFGYRSGAASVQDDWDRAKLAQADAQQRAVLAAVAANETARQADIAATKATLTTYKEKLRESEDRIVAERAAADRIRLRIAIPARVCATSPAGDAAGTGGADAAAGTETVELPEAVERGLRDVAQRADVEVDGLRAKVVALQDWIRTHGFYEVAPGD